MHQQLDIFQQPPLVKPEFLLHQKENNRESAQILKDNELHLKKQCRIVLEALCRGQRLTTTKALGYGIGDLRARIRDLKDDNKVDVQKTLIEGRYKEYWLTDEEIKKSKNRFNL